MAKSTTGKYQYSPDPVAQKLAADRAMRNRLHPAPWQLDAIACSGTIKYRVLDAINNPITEFFTESRSEALFIIEARNESYEEHCDHILGLWLKNVEELKATSLRQHQKWQEEVGQLAKALYNARDEIKYLEERLALYEKPES